MICLYKKTEPGVNLGPLAPSHGPPPRAPPWAPLGPPSAISSRGNQINLGLSHPAEEEEEEEAEEAEEDTFQSYASRIPTRTGKKEAA